MSDTKKIDLNTVWLCATHTMLRDTGRNLLAVECIDRDCFVWQANKEGNTTTPTCRALELQEGERHCDEGCECQTLTPSTWGVR